MRAQSRESTLKASITESVLLRRKSHVMRPPKTADSEKLFSIWAGNTSAGWSTAPIMFCLSAPSCHHFLKEGSNPALENVLRHRAKLQHEPQKAAASSLWEMFQFRGQPLWGKIHSDLAVMFIWRSSSLITLFTWLWNGNKISCYLWGLDDWWFVTKRNINRLTDMPGVHYLLWGSNSKVQTQNLIFSP